MSAAVTKRIWSQLWDPAKQLTRAERASKTSSSQTTFTSSARHFSWSRPRLQSHSAKRNNVSKSFASCGFLCFELSPTATVTNSTISTCTATAEKTLYTPSFSYRPSGFSISQQIWRRSFHSSKARRRREDTEGDTSSSSTNGQNVVKDSPKENAAPKTTEEKNSASTPAESSSSSYLHLPHMPKMPHRPTRDELLAAATGFWSRLKVRFKWFSIRSVRPWNVDDWSAFVSWFVLGNIVWILVGTTTFFSLVILTINTVVAQGTILILSIT